METQEEEETLFQIQVGNGQAVYVAVRRDDTMRDFRSRLLKVGITIAINKVTIQGKTVDEDTNVMKYFAAVENSNADETEETEGVLLEDEADQAMLTLPIKDEGESHERELELIFCAVPGCSTNKFDNPNVPLFSFPIDPERCKLWVQVLEREDLAEISDLSQFSVCALHFADSDYINKEKHILKDTSVPSIPNNQVIEVCAEKNEEYTTTVEDINENYDSDDKQEQTILFTASANFEESEIVVNEEELVHPGALCRLCANPLEGEVLFMFNRDEKNKCIADIVNACLPIYVKKTDPLPKQICWVCSQQLELHKSFTESCIKADEKLKALSSRFLVDGLEKPTIGESGARKCKRRSSVNYCCPLCCSGAMKYLGSGDKKVNTDSEGPVALPAGVVPDSVSQDFIHELYSDDEEEAESGNVECIQVKLEPEEEEEECNDVESTAVYLVEDMDLFAYECDICEESFPNGAECLSHCKEHAALEYFPCVVCGLVFYNEAALSKHFIEHNAKVHPPKRGQLKPLIECGACNEQFTTRKDFILHKCSKPMPRMLQSDSAELSCQLCERMFTNKTRAEAHRRMHLNEDLSLCQCGFKAETEPILLDHVSVRHDVPVAHSCSDCNFRFVSIVHLEKHRKTHLAKTTLYQCSCCERTFKSMDAINRHMSKHAENNDVPRDELRCPKCDQTFLHRALLQHHLEATHDSMQRMPSLIQYQCKVCSERITSSAEVVVHRTVHWKSPDPTLPYVCEYCGDPHPSPNSLARHRRYLHPDEHPYVCTLCNVATRTLYEARVHRKTHTGYVSAPNKPQPKIYQCETCPSLFSDKASFLSHKKSHKVSKQYICDVCYKSFNERHRLVVHKRQHTGEKPYSCGTCGKKFAQTSAMYTHALLHTGETPHACDICDRKFRIKSDRDNHRRTHTGEKPYKCLYCGKTFRTGQVYYQHRLIHTGERRFPCEVCGRAFKRSHTLVCHKRIHTGEKPNVCDICGKGFRQRTDMRKHKMNLHSVHA